MWLTLLVLYLDCAIKSDWICSKLLSQTELEKCDSFVLHDLLHVTTETDTYAKLQARLNEDQVAFYLLFGIKCFDVRNRP